MYTSGIFNRRRKGQYVGGNEEWHSRSTSPLITSGGSRIWQWGVPFEKHIPTQTVNLS